MGGVVKQELCPHSNILPHQYKQHMVKFFQQHTIYFQSILIFFLLRQVFKGKSQKYKLKLSRQENIFKISLLDIQRFKVSFAKNVHQQLFNLDSSINKTSSNSNSTYVGYIPKINNVLLCVYCNGELKWSLVAHYLQNAMLCEFLNIHEACVI